MWYGRKGVKQYQWTRQLQWLLEKPSDAKHKYDWLRVGSISFFYTQQTDGDRDFFMVDKKLSLRIIG